MNLATILDDCLQRLRDGETVAACLARYPQHAIELAPMLSAAVRLEGLAAPGMSPAQHARAKAVLRQATSRVAAESRQARAGHTSQRGWTLALGGAPRLAVVAAAVLLIFAVLTASVVAASQPGQPAYALRVVAERAPVWIHTGPAGRAAVELKVADRRLSDLQRTLADSGRIDRAALRALVAGDAAAARQAQRMPEPERLRIARRLSVHAEFLLALAEQAPRPQAAEALHAAAQRLHELALRLWSAPTEDGPPVAGPTPTPSPTPPATVAAGSMGDGAITPVGRPTPAATAALTPTAVLPVVSEDQQPPAATAVASPEPTLTPLPPASETPPPVATETGVKPRPPRQTPTRTPRPAPPLRPARTLPAAPPPRPTRLRPPVDPPVQTPRPRPRLTAQVETATAAAQTSTPSAEDATPTPGWTDVAPTATGQPGGDATQEPRPTREPPPHPRPTRPSRP